MRDNTVFDCLYVGYFYFLSLNFWKRRCDKASTEQSDHSKNVEPYVTRGVKFYDKNIMFTASSSFADLSVSVYLQNIRICHYQNQS